MNTERRRVFILGAWSPALRSLLNSTIMDCGCVAGVYQVWNGEPVAVVDVADPRCAVHHRVGDTVADVAERHLASPLQSL